MSQNEVHAKIRSNPKFAELVQKRTRFAVLLSLCVLVPYYTFMMLTALNPVIFTQTIGEGSVITIGWPIAAVLVIGFWLLTGVYVRRSNSEFDALNEQVLREAQK